MHTYIYILQLYIVTPQAAKAPCGESLEECGDSGPEAHRAI